MPAQNVPTDGQESGHGPGPDALMVGTRRGYRVGEFHEGSRVSMRGAIAATGLQGKLDLACDPSATRYAVAYASDVLRDWGVPQDVAADALLIVDELVTNAVRHGEASTEPFEVERGRPGAGGCSLVLWTCGGHLVICVHDETDQVPILREVSLDAENGRGLQIVAGLCDGAWGYTVQPSRPGKLVWAQLQLPDRTPPPAEQQVEVVA